MPVEDTCNADAQANSLYTSLVGDLDPIDSVSLSDPAFNFEIDEDSDLYSDLSSVSLKDLTEVEIDGNGVFDRLMAAVNNHLNQQFKLNRITGAEYSRVYSESLLGVLGTASQFVLNKDRQKWEAVSAQYAAQALELEGKKSLLNYEQLKLEYNKNLLETKVVGTQYALTKMQIANADIAYCLTASQKKMVDEQFEKERSQTLDTRSDGSYVQGVVGSQKANLDKDVETKAYSLNNLFPAQLSVLNEQVESERSKTLVTRRDGTPITGSVGKQIDLYNQQIDSFIKDAKQKTAKMYLDGWITSKTLDENLASPNELDVPSVSEVLLSLRTENNL